MTFNGQKARVVPWLVEIDEGRMYQGLRVLVTSGDKEIDVTEKLTTDQFCEAYVELNGEGIYG